MVVTIKLAETGGLQINSNISTLMTAMALAEASQTVLSELINQSIPAEELTEEEVAESEATPEQ